jgi:hypothetical protein
MTISIQTNNIGNTHYYTSKFIMNGVDRMFIGDTHLEVLKVTLVYIAKELGTINSVKIN